jgi:hypothetical protein
VEDVLQMLDGLTQGEARVAGARALMVVHGLVQNTTTAIDCE